MIRETEPRYSMDRVFAIMDAQGRRVDWLADMAEVSIPYVYQIRSGRRRLPSTLAERIARVLGVPVEMLEDDDDAA